WIGVSHAKRRSFFTMWSLDPTLWQVGDGQDPRLSFGRMDVPDKRKNIRRNQARGSGTRPESEEITPGCIVAFLAVGAGIALAFWWIEPVVSGVVVILMVLFTLGAMAKRMS